MKRIAVAALAAGILFAPGCGERGQEGGDSDGLRGTITMSGAWALYPIAVRWAEEFRELHPGVRIDVAAGGAGKGMADCLAQVVDIGMVSREIYPQEIEKGAWWVSVTKDAVVATVHEKNPVLAWILGKGIARETLAGIWMTGKVSRWAQVGVGGIGDSIHVYTRSDACGAAKTWAKFLGAEQEDLLGIGVYGDPGLAEAVKKDRLGIGFNNINYVYDAKTGRQVEPIRVAPIDINGNGVLEANEDFYGSRASLIAAIRAEQYPSPPARMLHFVSKGRPERLIVVEFIKWVLTDGQQYVYESGYVTLPNERILDELKKLGDF